ncbi:MAG TPA: hypothetical protein PKD74_05025, partial [Candidatus Dependentiae bacterium]|nr:hypothetical protein [Candidatus Dependentiae bacterium]
MYRFFKIIIIILLVCSQYMSGMVSDRCRGCEDLSSIREHFQNRERVMRTVLSQAMKLGLLGCNPSSGRSDDGLAKSIRDNNLAMVKLYLMGGSEPDMEMLELAFANFNFECIELLIRYSPGVKSMHSAAMFGLDAIVKKIMYDFVEYFLQSVSDVNGTNVHGQRFYTMRY